MIVTEKYIRDLREKSFINISEETEKYILEQFGKEPEPDEDGCSYEYTEQDLWEQIRKIISNQ
ncbi:hypothetical protein SOV_01100 [Sporomusa ovata DSM 2662]|uniref:Uncharacterized protein n=1 Tax=Sporomusa ovata TaxID=2378 RepID=A0A0U1KZ76_9FIRM|nr:hypothetical protein [Sporomusa ovata]EQB27793.1 hypothetical protein SOV_2c07020 [Sporomusa ovata DSM 2662]CQR72721.1 hypothetical protein SpAn4DRAFT_3181 [Sporomusa ovata]